MAWHTKKNVNTQRILNYGNGIALNDLFSEILSLSLCSLFSDADKKTCYATIDTQFLLHSAQARIIFIRNQQKIYRWLV